MGTVPPKEHRLPGWMHWQTSGGVPDALAITRAACVGTSMGAVIAAAAAARAPQRYTHLALCGAHLRRDGGFATELRERGEQAGAGDMAALARTMTARWFPSGGASVPPGMREQVADMVAATSPRGYAVHAQALSVYDVRAMMQALGCPVLLLAGDLDGDVAAQFETLAPTLADGRVEVFGGAGHFPNLQDPGRFNRVLETFLAHPVPAAPMPQAPTG